MFQKPQTRRNFLACSTLAVVGPIVQKSVTAATASESDPKLQGAIGIVSAAVAAQLTGRATGRNFTLLELPQILRDELDLTVVDLNTTSFPDFAKVDSAYLSRLRAATEKAGCVLTNLKMNQRGFDMNSADNTIRQRALAEYKRSIDVASELGCRWARPLPQKETPNQKIHIASYQELCDYAADKKVQMLVENFGWMQSDPTSVSQLIAAIGHNVAACPDTGNWNSNDIRYDGLKAAFPRAVTCDFKAKQLGPNGKHNAYDLKRCFDIAWDAGFKGPWAIEHGNPDTSGFLAETRQIRNMLRKWTAERMNPAK
jgi:sugar phosphate isomerase/epimerase